MKRDGRKSRRQRTRYCVRPLRAKLINVSKMAKKIITSPVDEFQAHFTQSRLNRLILLHNWIGSILNCWIVAGETWARWEIGFYEAANIIKQVLAPSHNAQLVPLRAPCRSPPNKSMVRGENACTKKLISSRPCKTSLIVLRIIVLTIWFQKE